MMTPERYNELMYNIEMQLLPEEVEAGWWFCLCEWDGLLIHKDHLEAKYCGCYQDTKEIQK